MLKLSITTSVKTDASFERNLTFSVTNYESVHVALHVPKQSYMSLYNKFGLLNSFKQCKNKSYAKNIKRNNKLQLKIKLHKTCKEYEGYKRFL